MAEEIEAKVKIADPAAFRRRMAAFGPPQAGPVLEVNRLLDFADGRLRRSDAAVRVRVEYGVAGGPPLRTLLAYKGPRRDGRVKRRPEFQTAVESADAVLAILGAMGLVETFRFEKRRTTWRAGDCEVVLDELPHLGWFAEVEGPTEEAVLACLADLGLAGKPIIKETYMRLLADRLAARGLNPTLALFAPGTW